MSLTLTVCPAISQVKLLLVIRTYLSSGKSHPSVFLSVSLVCLFSSPGLLEAGGRPPVCPLPAPPLFPAAAAAPPLVASGTAHCQDCLVLHHLGVSEGGQSPLVCLSVTCLSVTCQTSNFSTTFCLYTLLSLLSVCLRVTCLSAIFPVTHLICLSLAPLPAQVCLFNLVFVLCVATWLPCRRWRPQLAAVCTVWTCVLTVCKMLYQLNVVQPSRYSSNCSQVISSTICGAPSQFGLKHCSISVGAKPSIWRCLVDTNDAVLCSGRKVIRLFL